MAAGPLTAAAADTYSGIQGYDNDGGESVATLTWGSANWTVQSLGDSTAWPFFAGMALTDVNTMYVAGSNSAGVPTVFKSTNGGLNWASVLETDAHQNVATGWSGYGGDRGWGYGLSVLDDGRYTWEGGLGTAWSNVPSQDLTVVVLTQLAADETGMPAVCDSVLSAARRE